MTSQQRRRCSPGPGSTATQEKRQELAFGEGLDPMPMQAPVHRLAHNIASVPYLFYFEHTTPHQEADSS